MLVIAATEVKSQLGNIFDDLENDPSSSILIERNKKPAAMILQPNVARQAILGAYAFGALSRNVAMKQLGFEWYGDLLDALAQAGINRPRVAPEEQQAMVNAALGVLPTSAKPKASKA